MHIALTVIVDVDPDGKTCRDLDPSGAGCPCHDVDECVLWGGLNARGHWVNRKLESVGTGESRRCDMCLAAQANECHGRRDR
jgi:hypothetical protein